MKQLFITILIALALTGCTSTNDFKAEYAQAKSELPSIADEYGKESPEYLEALNEVNDLYKAAYPVEYEEKTRKADPVGAFLSYLSAIFVAIAFVVVLRLRRDNKSLNFVERITYFINPSNVFGSRSVMKSDWVVKIGAFAFFLLAYTTCIYLFFKIQSFHNLLLAIVVTLATMTASIGFTKVAD